MVLHLLPLTTALAEHFSRDSMGFMRQIEAHFEKGLLRPSEPLALRPGESVHLIIVRQADPERWNLERLAKVTAAEEIALTGQGLSEWTDALDREDHR